MTPIERIRSRYRDMRELAKLRDKLEELVRTNAWFQEDQEFRRHLHDTLATLDPPKQSKFAQWMDRWIGNY